MSAEQGVTNVLALLLIRVDCRPETMGRGAGDRQIPPMAISRSWLC